jgi:hypothetical protein
MGVLPASLCLSLALAAAPATERKNGADKTQPGDATALQAAEAAWRRGAYAEARRTLEPLAADLEAIGDAQDREKILLLLADSALNDPTLDAEQRRSTARKQLDRQMDADPTWKLAKDVYTPDLYDLWSDLRVERAEQGGGECEARRISCSTDLAGAKADLDTSNKKYTDLNRRFGEQEVEVREQVARTRILAAIPFGFGHFYNGGVGSRKRRGGQPPSRRDRIDIALGGTFLALEAAAGITGLALLIHRTVVDGCRRTKGFQSGSLVCDPDIENDPETREQRGDEIKARRKAEEAMAWTLLGLVVTDIVVAQVLFEAVETRNVKRVRRRDLDKVPASPTSPKPAPPKPRPKVRAAPSFSPTGVGLSVHVRF